MFRNLVGAGMAVVLLLTISAGPTAAQTVTELWFDNENTYSCDDPFTEAGCTAWLTGMTEEDCGPADTCYFGWSEGVIYMHGVRLVVDLTSIPGIDSVQVWYWGATQGDMRVFLYDGATLLDSAVADWYEQRQTVFSGGGTADRLAISACESELYEVYVYSSETSTGVTEGSPARAFRLYPARPNPFNPRTTISFDLAEAGEARLDVYDVAGRHVRSLWSGPLAAGRHDYVWDGANDRGRPMSSGIYFSRLVGGRHVMTERMLLTR